MTTPLETPTVAVLKHFWVWLHTRPGEAICTRMRSDGVREPLTGPAVIKNRDGQLETLRPNQLQRDLYYAMLRQALAGRPIRAIILKGRKMGCSTFIETFIYFLVRHYAHIYAQVVAHTEPSTRDIFEIPARMYVYDPAHAERPKWPTGSVLSFEDERGSKLAIRTFGGQFISSSANIQAMHISELAKVSGDETDVLDQMNSLQGSVADTPTTYFFIESTANASDESGEFERRCRAAMRGEGSFEFVFSPWFDEPSYALGDETPLPPLELADEAAAELELLDRFPQLTTPQLRWRRQKMRDLGGLRRFRQEYPSWPEEAFQVATGKVFPMLAAERHAQTFALEQLLAAGYEIYRGIDWGGVDPFVCVWVAHHPGQPTAFTLDADACPELWAELAAWRYDRRGRPEDSGNHGIDALRYAITQWDLSGHVHVFQEFYDYDFAAAGRDVADNAHDMLRRSGTWPIAGTVADRSRPDCLASCRKQGIAIVPYNVEGVTGRRGEIQYGVDRLSRLLVAHYPIDVPLPPPSPREKHRRRAARLGVRVAYNRLEDLAAEPGGEPAEECSAGRWGVTW